MDVFGCVGVCAVEQHGRQESALGCVCTRHVEIVGVAKDTLGFGGDDGRFFQHVAFLAVGDQRTHAGGLMPGIADHGLCKTCAQRLDHSVDMCLRGNDPADRGAFLTCLRGHLALDFLDEQIEFRRAGDRIGPKDRGVQAVLFSDKTNGVA